MGMFGSRSSKTASTGWEADTSSTVTGSQERPHQDGTRDSTGDLGDGGVCRNPSNRAEDQG